ncbi:MAG: hypothetical protein ACRCYU_10340 [Nocardioides sp.]
MTSYGRTAMPDTIKDEIGLYYPGPIPFTPVRVLVDGRQATVRTCLWAGGWGLKRSTKLPAEKRRIKSLDFVLMRQAGKWRVNDLLVSSTDCDSVPVKGLGW